MPPSQALGHILQHDGWQRELDISSAELSSGKGLLEDQIKFFQGMGAPLPASQSPLTSLAPHSGPLTSSEGSHAALSRLQATATLLQGLPWACLPKHALTRLRDISITLSALLVQVLIVIRQTSGHFGGCRGSAPRRPAPRLGSGRSSPRRAAAVLAASPARGRPPAGASPVGSGNWMVVLLPSDGSLPPTAQKCLQQRREGR